MTLEELNITAINWAQEHLEERAVVVIAIDGATETVAVQGYDDIICKSLANAIYLKHYPDLNKCLDKAAEAAVRYICGEGEKGGAQ